ncbi:helix-turn-helix transcriptional regulator [Brunnivagina elsteri]|uniref:Helix-turn-helix transcriptional regulator n=1 Tax=Brunnivagina elsteri CCALA 953 TaxID=987040 RepID=A0A2A2TGN2_9CYAN|nr:helix-turn-helix transcriptional regulator [Calothrix elsteri]PAX52788.1 helix-turn-helix transcriptional regulator [Calothrix elsteri CCALA 953]
MIVLSNIQSQTVVKPEKQNNLSYNNVHKSSFFKEVVEGFQDGILILTNSGQLVFANSSACRFCEQISKYHDNDDSNINVSDRNVADGIWEICKPLVENNNYCHSNIILSDEIVLSNSTILRVRVRWLDINKFNYPCLLVTLENRDDSIKNIALFEVKKYQLTPREAEIWHLYRSHYSYKKIAVQLFITINTVKKHMKNIHAKRQDYSKNNAC